MESVPGEKTSTNGRESDQTSPDSFGRAARFLAKLPPQVLGASLGLGGLGILWRDVTTIYAYDATWNTPTTWCGFASHGLAYLCHSIVAMSLVAYATKAAVHRNLLIAELRSSPKCATLATGPMALATVCTSMVRVSPLIACILWIVAFTLHLVCGAFYLRSVCKQCGGEAQPESLEPGTIRRTISDWTSSQQSSKDSRQGKPPNTQDGSPWTPAAFPPTVGIAALASCATGIEFPEIAAFSVILGVCWSVPVLFLVLIHAVRTKGFEVSQARTAIICAPFALCTAALWTVRKAYAEEEAESEVASTLANSVFQFLYIMAILLYFVFLAYAPFLWRYNAARAPGSAAFTFPTVIFAIAMVRSHEFNPLLGKRATQILAYVASIIATGVVLCVTFQFAVLLRGLWTSAAPSNSIPGSQGQQQQQQQHHSSTTKDTGHPKEGEVVSNAVYMAEVVGDAETGVDVL